MLGRPLPKAHAHMDTLYQYAEQAFRKNKLDLLNMNWGICSPGRKHDKDLNQIQKAVGL